MSLALDFAVLIGTAVVIYFACEFFTNGVEWLGNKLSVGSTATGTVLAAIGTALPESVVTFVAAFFGRGPDQKALGIGAALGGPLVLATIAYATVGLTLILCRRDLSAGVGSAFRRLSRDQGWFLAIFVVKLVAGLVVFALKPWLGALFLAAYAVYFWRELAHEEEGQEDALEPLTFAPKSGDKPPVVLIWLQTLGSLAVIFVASKLFVGRLDTIGPALGVKPQLLALFLSPIATELPETMNAIIWVRQGKHRLALANISGAMMIQATVPTAFGLFWTPWLLDKALVISGVVTAGAVAVLFLAFRSGKVTRGLLAAMGGLYLVFVGLVWAVHA